MKNKNKNTGSICFVDHVQPGIIRFNDGDALDGILAGTRAKAIVKMINEYPALVAVAQAAEAHQSSKPGDEMKNWFALQTALKSLAAVRSGSEVAK